MTILYVWTLRPLDIRTSILSDLLWSFLQTPPPNSLLLVTLLNSSYLLLFSPTFTYFLLPPPTYSSTFFKMTFQKSFCKSFSIQTKKKLLKRFANHMALEVLHSLKDIGCGGCIWIIASALVLFGFEFEIGD